MFTCLTDHFQQGMGNIPQILVHIEMRASCSSAELSAACEQICILDVQLTILQQLHDAIMSVWVKVCIELRSGDWRPLKYSELIVMLQRQIWVGMSFVTCVWSTTVLIRKRMDMVSDNTWLGYDI